MKTYVDRIERLEIDVDSRLAEPWSLIRGVNEWTPRLLGELMRACFFLGYEAALTEPVRGKLYRDHGYSVPERGV